MEGDEYAQRLWRHLHHDNTRRVLTQAGLYLLTHELVKDAVIEDVKRFFSWEFDDDRRPKVSDDYHRDVRAGGAKPAFEGSVDWLVERGALDQSQRAVLGALQDERNRVAHHALALVVDPSFNLNVAPLVGAADILKRIGYFFGQIQASTDPSYDGVDLGPDDVESGKSVVYSMVLERLQDLFVP